MSFSALNAAMARPFISATYAVMDFWLHGVLRSEHDYLRAQSITGIASLGFSGGDICSISDASSSLARELLTRFDTGQHCSTSFAANFSNSSPALPLSHGSN